MVDFWQDRNAGTKFEGENGSAKVFFVRVGGESMILVTLGVPVANPAVQDRLPAQRN